MIFPDANLLLYAEDSLSTHHEKAKGWWDGCLSGVEPVCLSWPVINAFLRISTNARLFERPLTGVEAVERVESWMNQPCLRVVTPTDYHWKIFQRQMQEASTVGDLISDAHLAALAIEHACTLYSSDSDFARFPELDWVNPLKG